MFVMEQSQRQSERLVTRIPKPIVGIAAFASGLGLAGRHLDATQVLLYNGHFYLAHAKALNCLHLVFGEAVRGP